MAGNGYNSNYVDGVLYFEKVISVYGDSIGNAGYQGEIKFFKNPVHKDSIFWYVGTKVGTISLNGTALRRDSTVYVGSSSPLVLPFKISNTGSDTGSFRVNLTSNQAFPNYSGYSSLPDTIYKVSEMMVKVKSYSNCNYIMVRLGNGSSDLSTMILSVGDTVVRFAKRDPIFSVFDFYTPQLSLVFSLNHLQLINNKNYLVITTLTIRLWDRPFSKN